MIVHAKVCIIDDRMAFVGSANLNNRSGGFDTELTLAVEADEPEPAAAIATLRNRLIGHYFNRSAADVASAIDRRGGIIPAIDQLNTHGRLEPIPQLSMGPLSLFVAAFHLGDPIGQRDTWRPLRRQRMLEAAVQALEAGGDPIPALGGSSSKSTTSGR